MGSFLLIVVALASAFAVYAVGVHAEHRKYQKCVEDIAPYLDAQEILYQEQDCKRGWHP